MNVGDALSELRPIGFWLKLVDRLIDEHFDSDLNEAHLSRRHWQLLNVLKREGHGMTIAEIDESVRPFLDETEPTARPTLDNLVERGWVFTDAGRYDLTSDGVAAFEPAFAKVSETRREVAHGITHDEYQATVAVLERMARNLGGTDATDS